MNITYHDFPQQVALFVGKLVPSQIYHIWRLQENKETDSYDWIFYEACSNIRLVWETLEYTRKHRFRLKDLSGWRIAVCRDQRYIQILTPYQVEKMALYKIPFEQLTPQTANEKELSATLY
jgi:hypothetical protein